jgi:hypothetical protein
LSQNPLQTRHWRISPGESSPEKLRPLANTLSALHQVVSKTEIPEIGLGDEKAMTAAVAKFTSAEIATKIMGILKAHWSTNDAKILRFRASIVHAVADLDYYCPVVEWVETGDVKVVALFNIENPRCYSWLAYYVKSAAEGGEKGQSYQGRKWVHWETESMGRLRTLFEAAANLAGILQWLTEDIVRIYCRIEPHEVESEEKYFPPPNPQLTCIESSDTANWNLNTFSISGN